MEQFRGLVDRQDLRFRVFKLVTAGLSHAEGHDRLGESPVKSCQGAVPHARLATSRTGLRQSGQTYRGDGGFGRESTKGYLS